MKELIEAFPENIKDALNIAEASTLNKPVNQTTNIVMCGLW